MSRTTSSDWLALDWTILTFGIYGLYDFYQLVRRIGRCRETMRCRSPWVSPTRAISIQAPARAVWPWLVQMGWRRAGWYSYYLIDNDRIRSAQRVIPEIQALQVGDFVPEGAEAGWTVSALEKIACCCSSVTRR